MLLDRVRPHAFRVQSVTPTSMDAALDHAMQTLLARAQRSAGLQGYALHRAQDSKRIVTIEAWSDEAAFRADKDANDLQAALYAWAATGGCDPTPVEDTSAGVIIIDTFNVWRPFVRPVSWFNIRNGEAFNRAPGCISTTVLRGIGAGSIATYARWRSVEDFAAAFSTSTGKAASSADEVNRAAARMTMGFVRPDYHSYDLVAFKETRT
jgi:quinol monooxygenase YgiN